MVNRQVRQRELEHHEEIYSGFAQQHFARPAVKAFRAHLVNRILTRTRATRSARVLSLGCGIGDTELMLAPHVASITGVDLSPNAIRQADADRTASGSDNVEFLVGDTKAVSDSAGEFDVVIAVFFLHHLDDDELDQFPLRIASLLAPGGTFYSLDPSRYRLAGALGRLLVPRLMARYQSPDERELSPSETRDRFERAGLHASLAMYDFLSTPLAGLFPGQAGLYRPSRLADEVLTRIPLLHRIGSNFELVVRKPG